MKIGFVSGGFGEVWVGKGPSVDKDRVKTGTLQVWVLSGWREAPFYKNKGSVLAEPTPMCHA